VTAAELRLAETAPARRNRRIRRAGAETASRRSGPPTFGSRYQPRLAETAVFREPRPESRAGGPGRRHSARGNRLGAPDMADPTSRGRNREPDVSAEERAAELRLAETAPARQNGRIPRAVTESASRRSGPPTFGSRKQLGLARTGGSREPRPESRAGGVGGGTGGRGSARGNRLGSSESAGLASRGRFREPEVRAEASREGGADDSRGQRVPPQVPIAQGSRSPRRRAASAIACSSVRVAT
jgi:hypothetical protein